MVNKNDEDANVAVLVASILGEAIDKDASVVHIEQTADGTRVRFRIDGALQESAIVCGNRDILSRIKALSGLDMAEERLPQDGLLKCNYNEDKEAEFKVTLIPGIFGEKAVLRRILNDSRFEYDLDGLGMDDDQLGLFRTALGQRQGLVLVSGPTGSGKNTTVYSALKEVNIAERTIAAAEWLRRGHLPGVHHLSVDDEIGLNFATALRTFLRTDMDIIYIREVMDLDTAELMVKAALEHNRLVFSTMHTLDAVGSLSRLINMGVEPWLIAESVVLIQAQRLLRRLCPSPS